MLVDVPHPTEEEIEPARFIRDPAEKRTSPPLRTAESSVRTIRLTAASVDEAAGRRVYLSAFADFFGSK